MLIASKGGLVKYHGRALFGLIQHEPRAEFRSVVRAQRFRPAISSISRSGIRLSGPSSVVQTTIPVASYRWPGRPYQSLGTVWAQSPSIGREIYL